MLYNPSRHKARLYHCHWRGAMTRIFNVDPLICPCCHEQMSAIYYIIEGRTVWDPPVKGQGKRFSAKPLNWGYRE